MEASEPQASEGRRVVIEKIQPQVDCGRFAVKRIVGEAVTVTADVFADGHDVVRAALWTRQLPGQAWESRPMVSLGNDRWQAEFTPAEVGRYEYAIVGWVDPFATWHGDLKKRIEAGQNVSVDLAIGSQLVAEAAQRARGADAAALARWTTTLTSPTALEKLNGPQSADLAELMTRYLEGRLLTQSDPRALVVDRPRARFSTWYELFPRSCSSVQGKHGTLRDVIAWLPRLEQLGFDVLYLPPIHPIGDQFRKGKNNAVSAAAGDVGSPWAIGSSEGGHKAILSQLGTLADLQSLAKAARDHGIDLALDIAFQCSPDHPYAKEHPEWFRRRPDGTIQYAENPPKKYQDIYPFDFESANAQALWQELTDVILYWCDHGVEIFRVDNPHTKPFAFWEFLIGEVKSKHPATIFLSEAFTRPKIMYRLAKLGFTQSYTYFTWRNTKAEFIQYFTELTQTEVREFFNPNLWPNTPDILPEHLQTGGRAAFVTRLVLAATLGASYGIYGPPFETLEGRPREPGSEEYLDSEKYELRSWDFDRPDNLSGVIAAVNQARRENRALQSNEGLLFHATDNDQLLCYSKQSRDGENVILVVANLHFHEAQHGFVTLDLEALGIPAGQRYQVQDLLSTENCFTWQGPRNFVELDPQKTIAHIFRVLRHG